MATQAQIDAARRNGAKSQGPKTSEGKAVSSMNALRHGMTAKAILLTNENPEAYAKLAEAYYEKFDPADDVERDLVDEMVIAKWRQRRDWSNEAALFDLEMDHQTKKIDEQYQKIDHACRYALAFRALADESKSIQLLTRYETSHRRSYYQALSTLLKLRTARQPNPEPIQPPVITEETQDVSHVQSPQKHSCETNPGSDEPTTTNDKHPSTGMATNGEIHDPKSPRRDEP
jgi:hypothetical protein